MYQFLYRLRAAYARLMAGRNGADELSLFTLIAGIVLNLLSRMFGLFGLLAMVLLVLTLFRMFSRNIEKRSAENARYLVLKDKVRTEVTQRYRRMKGMKTYKFFRCPGCHCMMRLRRGSGERSITCPKCGRQFTKKA